MEKTIRLLFPQWQGGNNPNYMLGAELLAWLAPENPKDTFVRIQVDKTDILPIEDGIVGKNILLKQLHEAENILQKEQPNKVIVFGGDCLVEQAPIDYLHGKYKNKLGVVWIDAHPDISTTEHTKHAHAMVLGNLLQIGDKTFSKEVKHPLKSAQVAYVGLESPLDYEEVIYKKWGIKDVQNTDINTMLSTLQTWIDEQGIEYLMIHLDLDVLDIKDFRSTLFANPHSDDIYASVGTLTLKKLEQMITGLSKQATLVGLGITEHLPWDVINLKNTLSNIDIFK